MKRRIDMIGVELEGGWDRTFSDAVIEHDGSVHTPLVSTLTKRAPKHYGEIPSPPFASLDELQTWMEKHYPTAINGTCGFHVHFSLRKNLYYSQLMDRAFFRYFRNQAQKWANGQAFPADHNFWTRLQGQNKFCTTSFIPHVQSQIIVKEQNDARRYTMLNYCYGMHGTIECRLAPMFDSPDTAISWVKFIVDSVEDWLSQRPPEKVMSLKIKTKDLDVLGQVRKTYDSLRRGREVA